MADSTSIEERICQRLSETGKSLVTAESCTGGLIAHRLTNVPGSSCLFLGGVVSYSNALKMQLLQVSSAALATYGAVSEEVARQMAEGARATLGGDYSVGVTGIAGPGGGTAEKPVGLVYIAVAGPEQTVVERAQLNGEREEIKRQTADRALDLLWEHIQ